MAQAVRLATESDLPGHEACYPPGVVCLRSSRMTCSSWRAVPGSSSGRVFTFLRRLPGNFGAGAVDHAVAVHLAACLLAANGNLYAYAPAG